MRLKILKTLLLLLIILGMLFYYPKLLFPILEWTIILIIALTFWLWRKELGFTIGISPLDQQTPEDFEKKKMENDGQSDKDLYGTLSQEIRHADFKKRQDRILEILSKKYATNGRIIAADLGVTYQHAKVLLYSLVKEGKIRCDGFPNKSLYTLSSSFENLAIDHIKKIIEDETPIITERRFVRIKHTYEIDAIFETEGKNYLVEVKVLKNNLEPVILERWIKQISNISQLLNYRNIFIYLSIVALNEDLYKSATWCVQKFTYEISNIPIKVIVLDKSKMNR